MEVWATLRRIRNSVVSTSDIENADLVTRARGLAKYKSEIATQKKWDHTEMNNRNPEYMFVWKLDDKNWDM